MNKVELYKSFKLIKESTYNNIHGVMCFKSTNKGPIVGITICTHGNEPCGLAVINIIGKIKQELKCGQVFIVLNNIKATEKYFSSNTIEGESACRFIDINMNRLPETIQQNSPLYEVRRAYELKSVWTKFDYAIDFHSTPQPSKPFIIEGNSMKDDFSRFIPSTLTIKNMLNIQIGFPAISFYGNSNSSILGLEAGSHNDNSALDITIESTLSLLSHLDMIDFDKKEYSSKKYLINGSIIVPNNSYKLAKEFPMFSNIKKGQVIARGNKQDILSNQNGLAILAPKGINILNHNEEALFICKEII